MRYKIITDTSSNLPLARLAGEDIDIIPFTYYARDDADHQMSCIDIDAFDGKAYYDAIRKGVRYNTSQITPQTFYDHIAPFARAGQDVLFISMSSGISGSYNSSLAAKEMLERDYPERSFFMLDRRFEGHRIPRAGHVHFRKLSGANGAQPAHLSGIHGGGSAPSAKNRQNLQRCGDHRNGIAHPAHFKGKRTRPDRQRRQGAQQPKRDSRAGG